MKSRKLIVQSSALLSILLLLVIGLPTASAQVVVEDTNISVSAQEAGEEFGGLTSFTLTISQTVNSTPGDSTDVLFDLQVIPPPPIFPNPPSSALITGTSVSLDEGADLYLAEVGTAGEVFSLDTINSGNFQPIVEGDSFSSVFLGPGDFFLAVATTGTDSVVPALGADRDVFGWARFNLDDGANFTLLDNAVAYDTGNIVIGQNAFAVPEPCSSIALLGLLGLGVVQRRRR